MRKFFTIVSLVVFLFVCTSCASAEERFYSEKKSITVVEMAPELNATFRDAFEPEVDYEIKDTFVSLGYYGGSAFCTFHVLSTDGKYYTYSVSSAREAERLFWIVSPEVPESQRPEDTTIGKFFFDGKELYTN